MTSNILNRIQSNRTNVSAPGASVQRVNVPAASAPIQSPAAPMASQPLETAATAAVRIAFVNALIAHSQARTSLIETVRMAIGAGYTRQDCIQWGVAAAPYGAGLSQSYVRSTVSSVFIAVTGVKIKDGSGRTRGTAAQRLAQRMLRIYKNDYAKVKSILLAARREVEAMEKASK